MTIAVLETRETHLLEVRIGECDCTMPDCHTRFVLARCVYRPEPLWVTCGSTTEEDSDLSEQVSILLENEPVDDRRPSEIVEHGVALIGMPWAVLTHSAAVATAQLVQWARLPYWMCHTVPVDRVWATRRCVFGAELTKVPKALEAMAYLPDAPVHGLFGSTAEDEG